MKRWVLVSVLLAANAVAIAGCARKPALLLGPKPVTYATDSPSKGQMVDDMRAWLQSLGPQDARTLQETGQISFPYDKLKASDPAHAQMVGRYVADMQVRLAAKAEKLKAKGLTVPELVPQTISFRMPSRGAYELVIEFQDGSFSNLPLSSPL
jgi:hypothetical protein